MKKPRRLIIFIIIIVVAIGLSAAAAVIISQYKISTDETKKTTAPKTISTDAKSAEADKLAYEGNVNAGTQVLDDAIKNTSDLHERFVYYSQKATLLLNHDNVDGALEAALQAYNIEKTSDSAAFIGQITRTKGNKQQAIDYYTKAISLIDSSDPFSNEDKTYYESVITELKGEA